jgi:hypothetical protein
VKNKHPLQPVIYKVEAVPNDDQIAQGSIPVAPKQIIIKWFSTMQHEKQRLHIHLSLALLQCKKKKKFN